VWEKEDKMKLTDIANRMREIAQEADDLANKNAAIHDLQTVTLQLSDRIRELERQGKILVFRGIQDLPKPGTIRLRPGIATKPSLYLFRHTATYRFNVADVAQQYRTSSGANIPFQQRFYDIATGSYTHSEKRPQMLTIWNGWEFDREPPLFHSVEFPADAGEVDVTLTINIDKSG
jgi:hypothetical protein